MSMYPRSIEGKRAVAALSQPGGRPSPTRPPPSAPTGPRRKPGRPAPARPRRPPQPGWRPRPQPAVVPKLPQAKPLPVIRRPRFPSLNPYVAAFGVGWAIGEWLGDMFPEKPAEPEQWTVGAGWHLTHVCDPFVEPVGWTQCSGPFAVQNGAPSNSWGGPGSPPQIYCLGLQSGWGCGSANLPWTPPNRFVNRVSILQTYTRNSDGLARSWFLRQYRKSPPNAGQPSIDYEPPKPAVPRPAPANASAPGVAPAPKPWQASFNPLANPINVQPDLSPSAPPLGYPHSNPWDLPEYWQGGNYAPVPLPMPGVVPAPGAQPWPGEWVNPSQPWLPNPLPPEVPTPVPLPTHAPNLSTVGKVDVSGVNSVRNLPRVAASAVPARPSRGKEVKTRLGPVASFLWSTFSPITETGDFIDILYENLPKDLKVDLYQQNGRQPNLREKLEAIYENINDLDVPNALRDSIVESINDQIAALGSGAAAEYSSKRPQPWGVETGPWNDGGPMVTIPGSGHTSPGDAFLSSLGWR